MTLNVIKVLSVIRFGPKCNEGPMCNKLLALNVVNKSRNSSSRTTIGSKLDKVVTVTEICNGLIVIG